MAGGQRQPLPALYPRPWELEATEGSGVLSVAGDGIRDPVFGWCARYQSPAEEAGTRKLVESHASGAWSGSVLPIQCLPTEEDLPEIRSLSKAVPVLRQARSSGTSFGKTVGREATHSTCGGSFVASLIDGPRRRRRRRAASTPATEPSPALPVATPAGLSTTC